MASYDTAPPSYAEVMAAASLTRPYSVTMEIPRAAAQDSPEGIIIEREIRYINLNTDYVWLVIFMLCSLITLPLIPLVLVSCCIHNAVLASRKLYLTNSGIHYTKVGCLCCARPYFIPLEQIKEIRCRSANDQNDCVVVETRDGTVSFNHIDNSVEFVEEVRRMKAQNSTLHSHRTRTMH